MKKKSLLALLLALCMLTSLLAGCGDSASSAPAESAGVSTEEQTAAESAPEEADAPEEPAETAEPAEASAEEPAAESAEEPEEPAPEGAIPGRTETVELPLTEEKVTITVFQTISFAVSSIMEDINDNLSRQELEARTNVHFDFTNTSNDAAETNFQLMMAGGDYTDVIESGDMRYNDGPDAAIEADVFLDLTDLLPEYCPNYMAAVEYYDLQADCTTEAGRYAAIYRLYDDVSPATYGPFIRSDFLEQVGMDIPTTYADYEEVLLAFKNELGISEPLGLGGAGIPNGNYLVAGYNVYGYAQLVPKVIAPYMQKDGEVLYGAYTQEFKDYLTMMHDWYQKGIIGSDFLSNHPMFYNSDGVIAGNIGIFYTNMDDAQSLVSANPDIKIAAIPDAVQNEGDTLHVGGSQVHGNFSDGGYVITTAATDEEVQLYLAVQNYMYSEEGSLLGTYGVEGETFTYNDEGTPWPTELILSNPDGLTQQQASNYYLGGFGLTSPVLPYQKAEYIPEVAAAYDTWSGNLDYAYYMPETVSISSEDLYTYNGMYTDISTYVAEMTLKFITGDAPLSDYDAYIDQLKTMGIEDCIAMMQTAYDNYLNK